MFSYITLSSLNDYGFCPYSIYLHNVYKGGLEDNYHATPQVAGKNAHQTVDQPKRIKQKITSLDVCSNELGLFGKIDLYDPISKSLFERKRKIKNIYPGHIWQLQGQYFCMVEMGYKVDNICIYSMIDHKSYPQALPTRQDKKALQELILKIKSLQFLENINTNPNKCRNCIYNNLCDKAVVENVYDYV